MKLPQFVRGMPQVAFQELLVNLKSVRLIVMALLSALLVVGGAVGFSALSSGGIGDLPAANMWGHPAYAANGSHVAVVWFSDPYGSPVADRAIDFTDMNRTPLGSVRTDADGFARLDVGTHNFVVVSARIGNLGFGGAIDFSPRTLNFSVSQLQADFDRHGRPDGIALSVLNRTGFPVTATVSVNGTGVGSTDRFGYIRFSLPIGPSNVTVQVGGESETQTAYVPDIADGLPFFGGPDFVLTIIATFSFFILSIFAIVLSFDAISKERVQGTMDLLLSRPSSRTGILLGKFVGAFLAVAIPVTLVNLAGIGVITAASGKGPTGGYAAAFIGVSFLLIALYVLIQLIMSTLAKTSGTAVLFGVLIWLLFNFLYPILTIIVQTTVLAGDPAGAFRFGQVAGLGNPTSICGMLVSLAAPQGLSGAFSTSLEPAIVGTAAVAWFVLLFILALWTFHKKAAE